jgi:2,3-dihydroxybenzoate-AMP ligase/malonyl CoA-acyl carrier protein transacylase
LSTAYVFPGQGAQRVGMAVDLADTSAEAAAVFEQASAALGLDLLALCRNGPADALRQTELTQPALLTASLACAAAARQWLPPPSHLAGMSLGEYTALVAARALPLADAVRLVRARGRLMTAAIAGRPVGMAAVTGLDHATVDQLCASVGHAGRCQPALYNAPRQVTVAGDESTVSLLMELAERAGADVRRLDVSSPFHTSLMSPVAAEFGVLLDAVPFRAPDVPVVANVTAEPMTDPARIRASLIRQLDHPVRWSDTIRWLAAAGVTAVVELGPGSVLTALTAQTCPELDGIQIGGLRTLRAAKARFNGVAASADAAARPSLEERPLDGFVPVPADRARRYRAAGFWTGETLDGAILAAVGRQHPDRPALVAGEQTLAYGQILVAVDNLAAQLAARGLGRQDRVVLQLPNVGEFALLLLALWRIGAIAVMALPSYGERELEHVLDTSGAVAIAIPTRLRRTDHRATIRSLRRRRPHLATVLTLGPSSDPEPGEFDLVRLAGQPLGPPYRHRGASAGDVALLLMSGGTTGLPKLIPRTHDDYLYNVRVSNEICRFDAETVYGAVLPVEHNFALGCPGLLGTLLAGGTVTFAPRPDPHAVAQTLFDGRVTVTALVPPLASQLAEVLTEQGRRITSLRMVQVGGARLLPHSAERVRAALGCVVQQVYGMAEGLLNFTRPDDPAEVVIATQGRPASPGDELRIVDELGRDVPEGEPGELWTRGPYTIAGYFRAEDYNRTALTPDGFYRTGDVVRRHASGNLIVEGRTKDVINRAGEKVSAAELEDLVLRLPSVRQTAVVSVPDETLGEAICVVVVLRDGATLNLIELRGFLADQRIARYKLADRLETVDELPLTPIGKPDKAALRRRFGPEPT